MSLMEFIKEHQKVSVEEFPNNVLQAIKNPIVSCRVSTYMHASYIRQCLDGIIMQRTNFSFEIIIGEDESTDGTREICIEYAKKYSDKIRLFLHKRENNIKINNQPSAKFQGFYSMYMCRGKYQAICEGDDYWTDPYKLQKQLDFLESHSDYSLCVGGFVKHEEHNGTDLTVVKKVNSVTSNSLGYTFNLSDLTKGWITKTLTAVFRKDILNQFDLTHYKNGRDINLFYHLLKGGNKGFYFYDVFGVYRVHEGGVNSMKQGKVNLNVAYNVYKELYEYNKDDFTRIMYLKHALKLFNYNLFNKYPENTFKGRLKLCRESIILFKKINESRLFIIALLPETFKRKFNDLINI